ASRCRCRHPAAGPRTSSRSCPCRSPAPERQRRRGKRMQPSTGSVHALVAPGLRENSCDPNMAPPARGRTTPCGDGPRPTRRFLDAASPFNRVSAQRWKVTLMRLFAVALAACILALPVAAVADDKAIADFYAGKTFTVTVGFSPGGIFDLYARILARHIGQH